MKTTYSKVGRAASASAGLLALSLFSTAQAGELLFGDQTGALPTLSSDTTDPDTLDLLLDFVINAADNTVTLTATNQTNTNDPQAEYFVDQLFWNTSGVELTASSLPTDWSFSFDENTDPNGGFGANGFGRFDARLIASTSDSRIAPGGSLDFTFSCSAGGCDEMADQNNFVSEFSQIPPGEHPALAAAHFQSCTGDGCLADGDSAFGAVVPIPAAVWLFGSGLVGLLGIGRWKMSSAEPDGLAA